MTIHSKLVLAALLGSGAAMAAQTETMRVIVAKSLLQPMLESAINEKRVVTGTLMDSVLSGSATTNGKLTADLLPNDRAVGIAVSFAAETESQTVGLNHPRHGITVGISSTSYTPLTGAQTLFLRPEGLSSLPPTAKAGKSALYYQGIDVTADGPFSDTTRISTEQRAWQKAWDLKVHNEDLTSRRVENEMLDYLNGTLAKSIESFNHVYRKIFYEPVFSQSGQLDKVRSLQLSSTGQAMTAAIRSDVADTMTPAPEFDGGNPLAFRIHDSLATRYFSESIVAKRYDEEDLEEFLIMHGIASGLGHYRPSDAQLQIDFCPDRPVGVAFHTLQIEITLCARELRFKNEKSEATRLTMTYTSRINPDGSTDLVRLDEPTVDHADGLAPASIAEVQKRLGRLFPELVSVPKFRLPGSLGEKGDLVTHRADLGDGWLVTELWFDPANHHSGGKQ